MAEQTGQAWSFGDGRFTYVAPLAQAPTIGSPVVVSPPDGRRFLGQVGRTVLAEGAGTTNGNGLQVLGEGALVALLDEGDGPGDAPFVTAEVETAPEAVFRSWIDSRLGRTARLDVGPARPAGLGTVQLAADGFTRHSFLCGQSGSGKTYTLGLLLEQLLLHTDLKVIVLDPNSDYVRIAEMDLEGLDGDARRRGESLPDVLRVFRAQGANPLRIRYGRLPMQQQALVLGLDPLVDAEQFDALRAVVDAMPDTEYSLTDVRGRLDLRNDPARRLALRIDNLERPTGRCGPAPTTGPSWTSCRRAGGRPWSTSASYRTRASAQPSWPPCSRRCGSGGTSASPCSSSSTRPTTSARRYPPITRRRWPSSTPSGSPPRGASTACTSSSPPSGRTGSTRKSSRSARTSCS